MVGSEGVPSPRPAFYLPHNRVRICLRQFARPEFIHFGKRCPSPPTRDSEGVTHDYAAIAARRAIATKSVCCDVHQVALKCSMASAPLLLQRIPAPFIRP